MATMQAHCRLTGHDKIHYIGHGMGATAFFVMADERPEYNELTIMANMMGPVASTEHINSPIRYLKPLVKAMHVSDCTVLGMGAMGTPWNFGIF